MPMAYRDTPVGFHRLYKSPLDDREVFTSNDDLINYCKSGAAYAGQHVAVVYDDYVQDCIIKKATTSSLYPVLKFPEGELVVKTLSYNGTNYTFALIYYFNAANTSLVYPFSSLSPRFGHWASMSLMHQSQLLSFALKTQNQIYTLEYEDANGTSNTYQFTQVDPIFGSAYAVTRGTSAVTKMWKRDSDSNAFILTNNTNINIVHKTTPTAGTIIRLWVAMDSNIKNCYFGG